MKWLKIFAVWFSIIPLAILNGGFREYILKKCLPENVALALSGLILCVIIYIIAMLFLPRIRTLSKRDYVFSGLLWSFLTISFEFGLGLSSGVTWSELLQAYNPMTGNLWILVLLGTFFFPILVGKYYIRMNAKENSKKSFDRQAEVYDDSRYGAHARLQYNSILYRIREVAASNLLDVGCGTGEMLKLLNDINPQMELTGIDISAKMLEKAKFKLNGKACLILGDAEKLPFKNNSFDVVICNDSFHHYPSPISVLCEFYRVLKPGGFLLISDYCICFPLRQLMNIFIRFSHDGDVRIYSKKEFLKMLCKVPFENASYEKINATGCIITAYK